MSVAGTVQWGRDSLGDAVRAVRDAFREEAWSGDRRTVNMPGEARTDRIDYWLLLVTVALLAIGLIMVFSSSSVRAALSHRNPYGSVMQQGLRALVGFVMLIGLARVNYRRWWSAAPVIALFTLVLLALLFVPGLGETHKGAQRWLRLGPIGIQPTEFARVGAIVLVARLLSRRPEVMARFQTGPLPALVVAAAFVMLILPQPSLGCTVALLLTVGSMCFVAGLRWKHLGGLVVAGLVAVPLLLGAVALKHAAAGGSAPAHNYQAGRISSFVAMWQGKDDPLGPTYQLRQSILAIGSGGLTGKGIGGSEQKWLFLPDAHTDFIFSIMGEEMGFLGACFLLLLFGIFIWRGLSIAAEADDRFGFMLAAGLTVNFGVYILINLAVTMGLMPTTGLPLPFVSYGGSALLANLAAVGLLLSVSRHRKSGIVLTNRSGRLR